MDDQFQTSDTEFDRLALRAQRDPSEFDRVERAFEPLMRSLLSNMFGSFCNDRDDMRQYARIGLWKAVQKFNPARGKFRSLAWLAAHRQVCTALNYGANLRPPETSLEAAQETYDHELGVTASFEDEAVERMDRERALGALAETLTPLELMAMDGMRLDDAYADTARRTGLTLKAVDNARVRCVVKALKLGEHYPKAA